MSAGAAGLVGGLAGAAIGAGAMLIRDLGKVKEEPEQGAPNEEAKG
jgi:hypothetical protein